jgi:hypothetical protein
VGEEVATSVAWVAEVATLAAALGMEANSLGVEEVATTRVKVGVAGMSIAWAAVATMPVGAGMVAAACRPRRRPSICLAVVRRER